MKITGTFEYIKHYIILIVLFTIFLERNNGKGAYAMELIKRNTASISKFLM